MRKQIHIHLTKATCFFFLFKQRAVSVWISLFSETLMVTNSMLSRKEDEQKIIRFFFNEKKEYLGNDTTVFFLKIAFKISTIEMAAFIFIEKRKTERKKMKD